MHVSEYYSNAGSTWNSKYKNSFTYQTNPIIKLLPSPSGASRRNVQLAKRGTNPPRPPPQDRFKHAIYLQKTSSTRQCQVTWFDARKPGSTMFTLSKLSTLPRGGQWRRVRERRVVNRFRNSSRKKALGLNKVRPAEAFCLDLFECVFVFRCIVIDK